MKTAVVVLGLLLGPLVAMAQPRKVDVPHSGQEIGSSEHLGLAGRTPPANRRQLGCDQRASMRRSVARLHQSAPLCCASGLNDITSGNNGTFAASSRWDAGTGLGSPDGAKIATLLEQAPTS
jgi:hypothetical protein